MIRLNRKSDIAIIFKSFGCFEALLNFFISIVLFIGFFAFLETLNKLIERLVMR
jgi:type IV secretory pathway TrbL component